MTSEQRFTHLTSPHTRCVGPDLCECECQTCCDAWLEDMARTFKKAAVIRVRLREGTTR